MIRRERSSPDPIRRPTTCRLSPFLGTERVDKKRDGDFKNLESTKPNSASYLCLLWVSTTRFAQTHNTYIHPSIPTYMNFLDTHKMPMKKATSTSGVSGPPDHHHKLKSSPRRQVTFHLPSCLDEKPQAATRFQELVATKRAQKAHKTEHRRRLHEARRKADEALERVSPSALMTEGR